MSQESTGRKRTPKSTSKPTSNKKRAASKQKNDKLPDFLDYDHVLGERNLDHAAIERDYFDNKNKVSRQASQSERCDSDSDDRRQFAALKNTIADSREKRRKEQEEKERKRRTNITKNDRDSVEDMLRLPKYGWGVPREIERIKKSRGAGSASQLSCKKYHTEEIGGLVGSRDDAQKHGGDEFVSFNSDHKAN
ncbi:uncharacterized protein Bfra_005095 [Botrytis fragariae]|uniref:Uncharacterized protein n=1 Tax=Botrytis fragariae TaxID=1964551 RepID=A0A8H6EIN2_9HELO|nr:uncharacterized protein Bfra_005095 [Botrytis fragariae]KAF5873631.1 hypothetical protein Bfra_005095 [Botrytis fragariae]